VKKKGMKDHGTRTVPVCSKEWRGKGQRRDRNSSKRQVTEGGRERGGGVAKINRNEKWPGGYWRHTEELRDLKAREKGQRSSGMGVDKDLRQA